MCSKEKGNNPVIDGTASKKVRFEALVAEYYNDIFRYAYWLSKSRQVAEDITQETFLRAWRALDKLENPGAAKAWNRNTETHLYYRSSAALVAMKLPECLI